MWEAFLSIALVAAALSIPLLCIWKSELLAELVNRFTE